MSLTFERLPQLIKCRLNPDLLQGKLGNSSFDTRTIFTGELFWALSSDKADGHDFVGEAFHKGAQAAVVSDVGYQHWKSEFPNSAFVIVPDPLKALQDLANAWRKLFNHPVIALTGSNGKTATKELLSAALGLRFELIKSRGNFNNHIGVPLTLLQIDEQTEIVLIEMGTNHPGDIELLCHIAEPTMGMVLNVGSAHLEGFGSEAAVADEKGVLLNALPESGTAFINCDDYYVRKMTTKARERICFGFSESRSVNGCSQWLKGEFLDISPQAKGRFRLNDVSFELNWYGRHQVHNALCAAVVADHFGVPLREITATFAQLPPLKGRLQVEKVGGITLIDDCYNANPASTHAALEFLTDLPAKGRKFAVLGDHLELGKSSVRLHQEIGKMVVAQHLDGVFLVGPEMENAKFTADKLVCYSETDYRFLDRLADAIFHTLKPGDALLVKASRGIGLDRLISALKTTWQGENN